MERPISKSTEVPEKLTIEQLNIIKSWCAKHLDKPRETGQPAFIKLEELKELKERGINLEDFLDYICHERRWLMHGSIQKIAENDRLRSKFGKIYGSNIAAVAIMRSLYSNRNTNLEYPYQVTAEQPFFLNIHFDPETGFIHVPRGYIYLIPRDRTFVNQPAGSWQYVSNSSSKEIRAVVETEEADFTHPVESADDLDELDRAWESAEKEARKTKKTNQKKSIGKPPKFRNVPSAR